MGGGRYSSLLNIHMDASDFSEEKRQNRLQRGRRLGCFILSFYGVLAIVVWLLAKWCGN